MDWQDLSHPMRVGMQRPALCSEPCIKTTMDVRRDPMNLMEYMFSTHLGTHVDAPLHFFAEGETIDRLPLDRFVGSGVVLSLDAKRHQRISAEALAAAGPKPEREDIVLVRTGWERHFDSQEYGEHPYLGEDAAGWLVAQGVKFVGLDIITPDEPATIRREEGFDWPVHRLLLGKGVLIAENLCNMEALAHRRVEVVAAPINIAGADGAPVRLLARPASA